MLYILKQMPEGEEIRFLKDQLRRMDAAKLAFVKGASRALVYAQDNHEKASVEGKATGTTEET